MASKKTIVLTGANGFLGGSILRYLVKKQFTVKALVHHMPTDMLSSVEYHLFELGRRLPENVLTGIDSLIHCAWLSDADNESANKINVEGTQLLVEQSRRAGITKAIFISSYSAHDGAISVYGKAKGSAEKIFAYPDDLVLKPGLIIGPGGLAKSMADFIRNNKFIPMIDGGKQPLRIIDYRDMCEIILAGIEKDISGVYFVAYPIPYSMRAFSIEIAQKMGKKIYIINMPFCLVSFGIKASKFLKRPSQFSYERLLGLKAMKDIESTDIERIFCLKSRSLEEAIGGIMR